jgi:hypothetical protein
MNNTALNLYSLPSEILFKISSFLDLDTALNFENDVCRDITEKFKYQRLGEHKLDSVVFRVLHRLSQPSSVSLKLSTKMLNDPQGTAQWLNQKYDLIQKSFSSKTIEQLRNRNWALEQLTQLSHYPKNPTPFSDLDLVSVSKGVSAQIGQFNLRNDVYQVRAATCFRSVWGTLLSPKKSYAYIIKQPNNDKPLAAFKEVLKKVSFEIGWFNPSDPWNPCFEEHMIWEEASPNLQFPSTLKVSFSFQNHKSEIGSDRLLDVKILKVAIEVFMRTNPSISTMELSAVHDQAAVFAMYGLDLGEKFGKEIVEEVKQHRQTNKTAFPPWQDYGCLNVYLERAKLNNSMEDSDKSWTEIVRQDPILYGTENLLPLYWTHKPGCLP